MGGPLGFNPAWVLQTPDAVGALAA